MYFTICKANQFNLHLICQTPLTSQILMGHMIYMHISIHFLIELTCFKIKEFYLEFLKIIIC